MVLGAGHLAGRGVYAAREFAAGEVVLSYRLQTLDEGAYLALPAGEELFVHSFGGSRYLYPSPARYVNHSENPSCVQDFTQCTERALRPIAPGEAITIDAHQETTQELSTFLDAYNRAVQDHSTSRLGALIAEDVTLWSTGVATLGRDAVVGALLAGPPTPPLTGPSWLVGTGRWEALCSANTRTAGVTRHHTILLKIISGNWQLVYQHID